MGGECGLDYVTTEKLPKLADIANDPAHIWAPKHSFYVCTLMKMFAGSLSVGQSTLRTCSGVRNTSEKLSKHSKDFSGNPASTAAQPPTVACKMEAQFHYAYIAPTHPLHVWRRFACSVGAYQQKFLHRSSGKSLLRVRCWLGRK